MRHRQGDPLELLLPVFFPCLATGRPAFGRQRAAGGALARQILWSRVFHAGPGCMKSYASAATASTSPKNPEDCFPAHPEGVQALSWQVVNPVEGLSLHGEAGSQGPISRPCLPASRPCCAVPPPSVSRLPEEMSKRGERAERAGGLMNFFRLGGGLGLESLRQLLGWSDSWRRCDGGHALHQKRTLFPRGLGAEAATMPSSSRMRCTPS